MLWQLETTTSEALLLLDALARAELILGKEPLAGHWLRTRGLLPLGVPLLDRKILSRGRCLQVKAGRGQYLGLAVAVG